jgi:rubrerythrin
MATNYTLARIIAGLIEDEWEAIEGYVAALDADGLDQADIAQIEEIISDEKEHAEKLAKISMKYDGNIPVSKD